MPPKNNEDIWGTSKTTAWVFDGATGLAPDTIVADPPMTDPRWLVEQVQIYLTENADTQTDIQDLYAATLGFCEDQFHKAMKRPVNDPGEQPCAASLIIKKHADSIICGSLSDCTLIIETPEGFDTMHACPIHKKVDEEIIRRAAIEVQKGLPLKEARQKTVPFITSQRRQANQPGGYSVFVPDRTVADKIRTKIFPYKKGGHALLMSDGFYCAVEDYHLYTDETLLNTVLDKGLSYIYDQIRNLEEGDPNAQTYPRMKKSDDCTAVLVQL